MFAAALAASLAMASHGWARSPKPRIEMAADLARFECRFDGKVETLVTDPAKFAAFADTVRHDTQSVLDRHEIAGPAAERDLLATLMRIDGLDGRLEPRGIGADRDGWRRIAREWFDLGDEAPFTSYGKTVVVHANGYLVERVTPSATRVARRPVRGAVQKLLPPFPRGRACSGTDSGVTRGVSP